MRIGFDGITTKNTKGTGTTGCILTNRLQHKVRQYLEKHKDSLIPVWLPTASPEFMVLEESWNISKKDL
ncbi:MAG: hypothetical protein WBZ20_03050, partial [Nitrososphaeraceae archaeon]